MIQISILLSMLLITVTKSYPLSEHPKMVLYLDSTIPHWENEMFESGNDPGSALTRTKRIGSLSIVNSMDVLRQRVLLELARRKALQDQRQIDANRRYLDSIGKRSSPIYNGDMSKNIDSRTRDGLEYTIEQEEQSHDRSSSPERISGRMDWFSEANPVFRRVQKNELRLF